mmetsp:Transcript_21053/g.29280  ORF Transcript_21053/g.29280 Transcript_21053/m.29280 type:complete len:421 (+) Transcript_21053:80-1342(+)
MCPAETTPTGTRNPDPKIIDILKEEREEQAVSLEYFPPRTDAGLKNLYARMERMLSTTKPLFTDMTWGAGGSTAELSLAIAQHAHDTGHVANMHLTCTNMEKDGDPIKGVHDALVACQEGGIRNIVALRGDPPEGQEEWIADKGGFTCALDLVKYIRKEFGDTFGISVAGYPEGHPNAISEVKEGEPMTEAEQGRSSNFDGVTYTCKEADYQKEMDYLKQKVDAGADFIITQMFFDTQVFKAFVKDCRECGITCPIVPGLMCINAYAGFRKMSKFCKTRVTPALDEALEAIKDDAEAVKKFGVDFGTQMCQELMTTSDNYEGVPVLHFYTLNLEKVVYGIMDQLGLSTNGNLSEKTDESDAKDMVAVGSAWARVGDTVKINAEDYGSKQGIVKEIKDGLYTVEMDGVEATFAKDAVTKVF